MAGTLKVGGKVLATHDSGTDEISLDSATNTSNMSFDANHAGIKTALNASGDAPIYACRAWVNFNGTDAFSPNPSTSAIRDSGNVSSVYYNGTGDYTINFATAMPDANYVVTSIGSAGVTQSVRTPTIVVGDTKSTTQLQIKYQRYDSLLSDQENCFFAIFR